MTSSRGESAPSPVPLLETKFYLPRPRHALVPRPRLRELLDRGGSSRLLLVSAPPGFGKTTLIGEWLTASPDAPTDERSAAWLSLDRGDNDPTSFWTYLVAALQRAAPGVGADELALLRAPQPPPIQSVLTTLLNELVTVAHPMVLVLDDYHVIESQDVQNGMAFLLDHAPPQLHLVIVSRSDPAVPLARLRARGELVEIRAADLRFTAGEAAEYLNGVMGLALTAADVAALEGRTEGWIAALQLAALSMQGRDDVPAFIAGFAGDDRYVVDYLVEEVLQRQPETVQTFLLQTSILERLSGSICDAVTGQGSGKAVLETLDRGNLFLVALDDRRGWYRYHQLFADVLQSRLHDEQPELVSELHRRASLWYSQHGEQFAAIRHALAGADFERAADLVERAIPAIRRDRQEARALAWLQMLPDELIRTRPVLTISYVGALLTTNQVEGVENRLQDAERWLDPLPGPSHGPGTAATGTVVAEDQELRRLPGWIAVYRAGLALALGDAVATVSHARHALDLLAEDDHLGRGAAAGLIGLVRWAGGDLEGAHADYAEATARLRRAGHVSDVLGCSIALADIRITQGRLHDAMRTYEQALELAAEQGGPVLRGTADMYVGMSALHREHGDLEVATRLLIRSQELGEYTGLPQNPYRGRVALARIREAEGDLAGALELLEDAERMYVGDYSPNVRPVAASRVRVWIAQGRLGDAFGWARERGLSVTDELSYAREFEHVTLARALVAQYRREPAKNSAADVLGFLERLRNAAEAGGRTGTVIEVLVLQALAQQLRGDVPGALAALEQALILAEPEGYLRILVDEGPPMADLLRAAAKQRIAPMYVRRLLAAMSPGTEDAPVPQHLVEPLSERELVVLRLLGSDLGGPDIARELTVSLNTLRTHTRNVYAKLGVNDRRAAVRRAAELGLLSRSRSRQI